MPNPFTEPITLRDVKRTLRFWAVVFAGLVALGVALGVFSKVSESLTGWTRSGPQWVLLDGEGVVACRIDVASDGQGTFTVTYRDTNKLSVIRDGVRKVTRQELSPSNANDALMINACNAPTK